MKLHVGCAMWAHAAWPGRHFPQPLPQRERLRAYASWCNAVEGNTTFYATPSVDTVRTWAEQTPADFRFVLKLPKAVTHERRLADVDVPLKAFFAAIEPLGPRAHTLWIQLPAAFGPSDLGTLAAFLRRLPHRYRYTVEVRHRAFFEDEHATRSLEKVLARAPGPEGGGDAGGGGDGGRGDGAEWTSFDTTVLFASPPVGDAERESWSKKPRLPRRTRALTAHPVVRYIGRDDEQRTADGWHPWRDAVVDWLREGRSPTVFIHTPDNVDAPALARRFHDDVRARVPELDPLPEPMPTGPPTLF